MGRRIECFVIEWTGRVRQQLRRYNGEDKCPSKYSYHNGHAPFGTVAATLTDRGTIAAFPDEQMPAHDDPRWPVKCDDCDYVFKEEDHWQVFQELLYHRPGVDGEFTLRDPPVGAIWDCDWIPTKGPDGRCLSIMTPGGAWMPDLSSSDGTPWQRTGALPKVTVRPSILFPGRYHGFLTDGILESCPDSPV